ncbi:MAG TPA: LLM class F420-dependent oxidoreductase [Nocardioidaceae bacterium]|nr:LLM class F420-dependent oxidoreductase [Nocardioidaceae bacterium]
MRIGLHAVSFAYDGGSTVIGPTLAQLGSTLEEAGFDNLSFMDHFFQIQHMGPPDDPMLEGYTTLGFLAAHTSAVELQLLVTGVSYRHPGILAKIVSTLDVLSGGRALLGIGAAWNEEEHRGLGIPFPPLKERFERLEETLRIVRQMWSDDDGPFEGVHYRLERTLCSPQPLSRIPIMLGGQGEKKTLRFVAQYADACNLFANDRMGGADAVAHKLDVLRRHCEDVGRPYDELRRTILYSGSPEAGSLVEAMKPYADIGIDEVHVMDPGNDPVGFVRSLASVVPALHDL